MANPSAAKPPTKTPDLIELIQVKFNGINDRLQVILLDINELSTIGIDPLKNPDLVKNIKSLAALVGDVSKPKATKAAVDAVKEFKVTPVAKQILDTLPKAGETGIDIAEIIKRDKTLKKSTVIQTIGKMVAAGLVVRPERGLHTHA